MVFLPFKKLILAVSPTTLSFSNISTVATLVLGPYPVDNFISSNAISTGSNPDKFGHKVKLINPIVVRVARFAANKAVGILTNW